MEKYQNPALSFDERAKDLVSRMTVEEKASQLRFDAPAIPRLGIPAYNWWNEALHGVARAGTATMFPQAIALAAMFDDDKMQEIGDIISTEARAKYNMQSAFGDRDIYKGLTLWSPNINIFRDPRWGRGHETYGEDPYLTTRLGVRFIEGIQGDGKYLKAAACAKHFAVHSGPESIRHEFDAIASKKDMEETYLPAFEAAVKEAKVESVMGAYNRTNGEPCCAHTELMEHILREKWGFDGHFTSDCWAIRDFHTHHMVTKTAPESAALALKKGCDTNCGNTYLHLMEAYQEGLVTEEDITIACERLMRARMRLGLFDSDCPYDQIPYEEAASPAHEAVSLEVAEKSMVLLKNNGILPLDAKKLKNVAVIGPNADSKLFLKGNYFGTGSHYVTLLDGIRNAVGEDTRVFYSEGCHISKDRVEALAMPDDRLAEADAMARRADVVFLCLGLDSMLEGEEGDASNFDASGDKLNLELLPQQQKLLETVVAAGTPVVLLLGAGSAMAIPYADEHCAAILDVWYPGNLGGTAAANILFGKASPCGKLPVTFYHSTSDLPEFTDYSMKNRTYRYYQGEVLYPFGYGLTYGDTAVTNAAVDAASKEGVSLTVTIENHSDLAQDDVVQCYLKALDTENEVPNYHLAAFRHVSLAAHEAKTLQLTIAPHELAVVNDEGVRSIEGNRYTLWVGTSQPDERSVALTGKRPIELTFMLND